MAQQRSKLDNLNIGDRAQLDYVKVTYNGSRFKFFKEMFKRRLGSMLKLSAMSVIFFLPLLFVAVYFWIARVNLGLMLPFNGNVGIGYPSVSGVLDDYKLIVFSQDIQQYALFVPLMALGFVGLAGSFRVAKLISWDRPINAMIVEFFVGIKQNFFKFMIIGLFFGVAVSLVFFNVSAVVNLKINLAIAILTIIGSIIVFIILFSACMFMCTQAATFRMSMGKIIKNSFVFSVGLFVSNLFFLIVSILPFAAFVLLAVFVPSALMIALLPMILLGVAYVSLIYTLYSHFVYERFLVGKIDKKQFAETKKQKDSDTEDTQTKNQKKPVVRYSNPKKSKPTTNNNLDTISRQDVEENEN